MESFVIHYLLFWKPLGYAIAFFGMMLEGEFFLLTFGFLTSQGYFNIFSMIPVLLAGGLLGDFLWYWLGKYFFGSSRSRTRLPKWIHWLSHPVDRHLTDRPQRTMFISKFIYGANHATLMRAGALKVSSREFFKSNLYANCAWIIIVGGFGYLFGASLGLLKKYIRVAEIGLLIGAGLFLLASHFFVLGYIRQEDGNEDEI